MPERFHLVVPLDDPTTRPGLDADACRLLDDAERQARTTSDLAVLAAASAQLTAALVPRCRGVAVVLARRHRHEVAWASDEALVRLVQAEDGTTDGPCGEAARTRAAVQGTGVRLAERWPAWARTAGLGDEESLLFLPLLEPDRAFGTLVVSGVLGEDVPPAARSAADAVARMTAGHANRTNVEAALDARTVVGRAEGLVMGRLGVDAAAAFDVLRTESQRRNTRVQDVARRVVERGGSL